MKSNKIVRVFGVLFFVILLINISAVSAQERKETSNQLNSVSIFIPDNKPWTSSSHIYQKSETIPYEAYVDGMERGDYIKYRLHNEVSYHQLPPYPRGESKVVTSLPASSVPEGSQRFTVRVYNWRGEAIRSAYRDYFVEVDYRIELSPDQSSYIDFDNNDDTTITTMNLVVQKSTYIETYIYRPSSGQYIYKETKTTNFAGPDNDWDYTFNMVWLEDSSHGAIAREDLCHTPCKVKFVNNYIKNYQLFSQELEFHFRVLWNRADITISLRSIYVGTGGWESEIEVFWRCEQMVQNQYTKSGMVPLTDKTTYMTYSHWSQADRIHEYSNGADGSSTGWWRKDVLGDIIPIDQQRRSIQLYDDDPIHGVYSGVDDLCHIFYFWLDPLLNPGYRTTRLLDMDTTYDHDNRNVELDVDGYYCGIYWKVERPDWQWGDYWNEIIFYINLFPTRL